MRFQSLQVRLAVRLAVLYVAASAMAAGVLIYQAYDTADSLHDRELSLRAEDLARAVSRDDSGLPQLKLPAKLASGYVTSTDDIFAVRDAAGRILAASPPQFGDQAVKWPLAKDDPTYFHLTNLVLTDYYGPSVELKSAAGRYPSRLRGLPVRTISSARSCASSSPMSHGSVRSSCSQRWRLGSLSSGAASTRCGTFHGWRQPSAPIRLPSDCPLQTCPQRSSHWSTRSMGRLIDWRAALSPHRHS